jgi:hypothetical protein
LFNESWTNTGTMVKAAVVAGCVNIGVAGKATPPVFAEAFVSPGSWRASGLAHTIFGTCWNADNAQIGSLRFLDKL